MATCDPGHNPLFNFVRYLLQLRRNSEALKQRKYGDLVLERGTEVTYKFTKEDGSSNLQEGDHCVMLHIDGSTVGDSDFLLIINMHWELVAFTFPLPSDGGKWLRIIDTASWAESNFNIWQIHSADMPFGTYELAPYSIAVFCQKTKETIGDAS